MSIFSKCAGYIRGKAAGGPAWKKYEPWLAEINRRRAELERTPDNGLAAAAGEDQPGRMAAAAVACERALGQRPFDVQILGALAMADGHIAEMQTGEGKTLTATLTVSARARSGAGFHVLTANDYLARRDAAWMAGVYRLLGLSVGHLEQGMTPEERRRAYACDITYATANEVGFDYLRDGLALRKEDLVQRPFEAALVDEADSILIDEARIPLVIAGGEAAPHDLAALMARIARMLQPGRDYGADERARNVHLTDAGLARAEAAACCGNLYDSANAAALAALESALHAQALLRRDVDYVIKNDRIELVDEFKGRIAENRRWPAGLQTALEAKEGLKLERQGRILGSITLHNLISLYPWVCGMTGTAATQAKEFSDFYGLDVIPIPTNRPVIRTDHPDVVFPMQADKERAVLGEIVKVHSSGRPVLVGTASVAESERLSQMAKAAGIPHEVLNARNDEREARVIAQAGARGAVTISTNMAGRGTDIPLGGPEVASLGGLHVIGTNRYESRRIDHQLRGRAGRQGDPGSSRFFVSLQDDLPVRYGVADLLTPHAEGEAIETVQRIVEEENLEIRQTLRKYEFPIEQQRRKVHAMRRERLLAGASEAELNAIDERWADYLAAVAEVREGGAWIALGGKDPFPRFLEEIAVLFEELMEHIEDDAAETAGVPEAVDRGATWTYLINDQPFGTMSERVVASVRRRLNELMGRTG